jgi:hypothetical protein
MTNKNGGDIIGYSMGMIPVALKHGQEGYPQQNGGNLPAMELIAGGLYSTACDEWGFPFHGLYPLVI